MMEPLLETLSRTWLIPSLVSAFLAFLLGVIWYHPNLLGGRWNRTRSAVSLETAQPPSRAFFITVPLWFLTSLFFTFIMFYFKIEHAPETLLLACLLWVAFSMPPLVMGSLYTGDPFNAVAVDAGYQLGGLYVIALTHMAFRSFDYFVG